MRFSKIFVLLTSSYALQYVAAADPAPPELEFLYTAFADCAAPIDVGPGPKGDRQVIQIVGGNFTGPRLQGKILNLGADWGLVDRKGTFSADTRYHLRTNDNANIFIRTSGPQQPNGDLHLRAIFETGDERYYWLNNIVAIARLRSAAPTATGFTLRIDTWNMKTPSNSTG